MEKTERWKERLKSYSKALLQLESALQQKTIFGFGRGWCN